MKRQIISFAVAFLAVAGAWAQNGPRVRVEGGMIEGRDSSGVKVFEGIPFAQPPVGDLRWKAPQPVKAWEGVRETKTYGNDPMMYNAFGDMKFQGPKHSEDCLYLNVWTPAKKMDEKLPILIYFNGGGLMSGDGSEYRYEGVSLARKGIIVVTANYREGIFGFFAHPQLSKETSYKGSGNYGWMDQAAAIKWVYDNIAAFGGDPKKITIVGESAGSMSTSALMVSPLCKDMLHQVMGSSGSVVGTAKPATLKEAEQQGVAWAKKHGFKKISDLRKLSADSLNKISEFSGVPCYNIDGYFLTEDPEEVYKRGDQAQVAVLIGNNSGEMPIAAMLGGAAPTVANTQAFAAKFFGTDGKMITDLYNIKTDADVTGLPGYELGGDVFISYNTWKWCDLLRQTSKMPVYRYIYCHPRPNMQVKGKAPGLAGGTVDVAEDAPATPPAPAAVHSADIEYAMGNLATNTMFPWTADDYVVSAQFSSYYVNFVKYGNPNGLGLVDWKPFNEGDSHYVLHIDVDSKLMSEPWRQARYNTIDKLLDK